jgi:hypothetical protein
MLDFLRHVVLLSGVPLPIITVDPRACETTDDRERPGGALWSGESLLIGRRLNDRVCAGFNAIRNDASLQPDGDQMWWEVDQHAALDRLGRFQTSMVFKDRFDVYFEPVHRPLRGAVFGTRAPFHNQHGSLALKVEFRCSHVLKFDGRDYVVSTSILKTTTANGRFQARWKTRPLTNFHHAQPPPRITARILTPLSVWSNQTFHGSSIHQCRKICRFAHIGCAPLSLVVPGGHSGTYYGTERRQAGCSNSIQVRVGLA